MNIKQYTLFVLNGAIILALLLSLREDLMSSVAKDVVAKTGLDVEFPADYIKPKQLKRLSEKLREAQYLANGE